MAKLSFFCDSKDREWLLSTHLKYYCELEGHNLPQFLSFMIIGNEDCPEEIMLYTSLRPVCTSTPVAKFLYRKSLDRYERIL